MNFRLKKAIAVTVSVLSIAAFAGTAMAEPAVDPAEAGESAPAAVYEITCQAEDIVYANVPFDYAEQIAQERVALTVIPEAAAIELTVIDAIGASGVELVASLQEDNTAD